MSVELDEHFCWKKNQKNVWRLETFHPLSLSRSVIELELFIQFMIFPTLSDMILYAHYLAVELPV